MRARPFTYERHKAMFDVNGVPNMERIIGRMRDEIGIRRFVIAVGYLGDQIREHFGDGSHLDVEIVYVQNDDLDRGWAWSVRLAEPHVDGPFLVVLCDEYYKDTDQAGFAAAKTDDVFCVVGGFSGVPVERIAKNFSVVLEGIGPRVSEMIENPTVFPNDLMGAGTFILDPWIFEYLQEQFEVIGHESIEFVDHLSDLIGHGKRIDFFDLGGRYVNINDAASLDLAREIDAG